MPKQIPRLAVEATALMFGPNSAAQKALNAAGPGALFFKDGDTLITVNPEKGGSDAE